MDDICKYNQELQVEFQYNIYEINQNIIVYLCCEYFQENDYRFYLVLINYNGFTENFILFHQLL